MYVHPRKGEIHFTLNEKSISHSIYTFLEYMTGSDMIYTKAQTLSVLKRKIDEYTKRMDHTA
jgi:hypothetical protein